MAYSDNFSMLNCQEGALQKLTEEELLRIYYKICWIREFEEHVIIAVKDGRITYPVYLSMGQEALAVALSEVMRDFQVFAQHRAHDVFLAWGGNPQKLRDELLGRESGSSGGRAGSNCLQIHGNGVEMYGHHGLIGENVPLAVGAALGNGRKTVCMFGDGAAEEDYIYPSLGFAVTNNLPISFVCVDNNLSILTQKNVRRNWELFDIAREMGMQSIDMSDCPFSIIEVFRNLDLQKPVFFNCRVCRERWHVGVGCDGKRAWERNEIVRNDLVKMGLTSKIEKIEAEIRRKMEDIWCCDDSGRKN